MFVSKDHGNQERGNDDVEDVRLAKELARLVETAFRDSQVSFCGGGNPRVVASR